MTTGGLNRLLAQLSHSQMWRSVPQTPAWWTRISTSLGPQAGTGTSRTTMLGPGAGLTRARIEAREEVAVIVMATGREGDRGGGLAPCDHEGRQGRASRVAASRSERGGPGVRFASAAPSLVLLVRSMGPERTNAPEPKSGGVSGGRTTGGPLHVSVRYQALALICTATLGGV